MDKDVYNNKIPNVRFLRFKGPRESTESGFDGAFLPPSGVSFHTLVNCRINKSICPAAAS